MPTLAELGIRDYEALGWFAVYAPAYAQGDGLQAQRGNRRAPGDPKFRKRIQDLGLDPQYGDSRATGLPDAQRLRQMGAPDQGRSRSAWNDRGAVRRIAPPATRPGAECGLPTLRKMRPRIAINPRNATLLEATRPRTGPRRPRRKAEAGESTRLTVLAAALRIRRQGAGARVDEIAQQAGVNQQAIYYHFGSKDELFRATLGMATRASPAPTRPWRTPSRTLLRWRP